MKLEKLIIKNFRGLKGDNNIIDFTGSDIIFLIGQNNVGKSSILRAYEFFVSSNQKATKEDFYNYDNSEPIIIEGKFIKEQNDETDPELEGSGRNAEPDWINRWVDQDNRVRVRKTWESFDETFKKETFSPQDGEWVENGFGGLHQKFQKYTPTPITINAMETEGSLEDKVNKLIQDDFIKKIKDDYPEDYEAIVNSISDLQEKILGTETVENLNSELNENFKKVFAELTLRIEPKEGDKLKVEDAFKKHHSISVIRDGITRKETFIQHGHGVIRQALFNFLSFLKRASNNITKEYLILFEEPELYLHPNIAFRLRQSLYDLADNSPYQIICATHSPLMIDISKPHSSLVRLVKSENEETKTFQVGDEVFQRDDERKQRVQMINRFNPHICEAFYADKVILVEGDTEAIVFRDLLNKFYPNHDVFVLNTGSKNNMPFFQEVLTAFEIQQNIVHDSDTRLNSIGNTNSAWTLNERIWDKVEAANAVSNNLAKRYIHITNFETAHQIDLTGKDKPIKAYEFVSRINDLGEEQPCLDILRQIMDTNNTEQGHDQEYLESNVPE